MFTIINFKNIIIKKYKIYFIIILKFSLFRFWKMILDDNFFCILLI